MVDGGPNEVTIANAVSSCAIVTSLKKGRELHTLAVKMTFYQCSDWKCSNRHVFKMRGT